MNSLKNAVTIETIKQAQQGSVKAFNKIFYEYKSFVEYILRDYIKDDDEAKDLANIVFLKIHDKLMSFTDYVNFKGGFVQLRRTLLLIILEP